jgi:hypothetical protein
MPDLNLDRLAHLVTTHPLASVVAALLLGWRSDICPAELPASDPLDGRGCLWVVLGVSDLPLMVVFVALDRLGGTGTNTVPSPVGPYNIWEQVLARIEEAIQPHPYFAFFRDTVLVSDDAVIIRVRVRSSDAGEWIAKHHADALREAFAGSGARMQVLSS